MVLFLRIFKDVETNCSNYTGWLQVIHGCGIMLETAMGLDLALLSLKKAADWEKYAKVVKLM